MEENKEEVEMVQKHFQEIDKYFAQSGREFIAAWYVENAETKVNNCGIVGKVTIGRWSRAKKMWHDLFALTP